MRYGDLVQFDPIESVIQLTDADDQDYAYHLLDTYVISERMAEVLDELVIEQLQFERPVDNKGLLIVGNYGTGKSHLMSVISAIAERSGASQHIRNERIAKRAEEIEGRFKVIRTEIGGVQMSLRDIVCGVLEEHLAEMGVEYTFPAADQIRNNKDSLIEMMAAFHDVYPDHGLLLVVDELLDFLKSRKEQELYLDLNFMREVGEICSKTRFRFIAGVQEMLFDNPTFQFVAEQLRRVRERFEQVRIVREDIAYVVSERLLKKDERQMALIREHLGKFTRLYHRLSEDMEQFVRLFPVHPEYLATFEKVTVAEKRVILKTLSHEMKKLMSTEVPEDEPGVISFDSYWPYIEMDPSLKSNPDIKEVMSKTKVLQDRIRYAFTRPLYKPMAERIVKALAVFRLTTDDLYAKVGLTPTELRDGLFLHLDTLDEDDPADFLQTSIEAALRELQKTVSFQYISTNEANGQYYLDIKKDIAVDERIEQKADGLSDDQLDRYYFEALKQVLEVTDTPYRTGYKIWPLQLTWDARKVKRQGYIFFGAPNERSTAQPPRDFYVYMLQPFDPPKFKDEERADEVFFRLVEKDETFVRALKLYAGAQELALTASSSTKKLYEQKGDEYLRQLVAWLRDNVLRAYEVTYRGKTERISQFGMFIPQQGTVREIVDAVAEHYLHEWFEEKYFDYPSFKKLRSPLTQDNLKTYVQDAFRQISGTNTRQGHAILDGLVLLEGDRLNPRQSGYARPLLDMLDKKAPGQVVNRSALIETVYTGEGTEDVERTIHYHLEPELYTVVLAALVYNGDIVITVDGKTYDAMQYEQLIRLPIHEIVHFSHVKKPSGLPLAELHALFDLLGIERSLLQQQALRYGIVEMQKKARSVLEETAEMLHALKNGFTFMNKALLTDRELADYSRQLDSFKTFLESLEVYNTPAKLNNFHYSVDDVERQQEAFDRLLQLQELRRRLHECAAIVSYIESAMHQLGARHVWTKQAEQAVEELADALKGGGTGQRGLQKLIRLKHEYIEMYMERHSRVRLNATEEDRKAALLADTRVQALETLAEEIELLPRQALHQWKRGVAQLRACWKLTEEDLKRSPECPHCRFSLRDEYDGDRKVRLDEWEDELEFLMNDWVRTLVTNLNDQSVRESISLLDPKAKDLIQTFIEEQTLVLPLDPVFVRSVQEVLQGIEKVEITHDQWMALTGGGHPMTVDELRDRFEQMLKTQIGGKPTSRVRIMFTQGEEREDARHEKSATSL